MAFKALDKLQINNTDVLTFDGTNIILSNVLVDDGVEISINSDNLTEGTVNRFFTPTRETVLTNADIALDARLDTLEGAGTGSVAKALVDAKAYTDQAELDAIATANTYADTAEADANTYTDSRETAITTAFQTYADTAEADAIASAEAKDVVRAAAANAYADSAVGGVANHSTTDTLTEGSTNLYYTPARDTAQFDTDLATKSTTNLTEGTNLYYTDARADARAQAKIDTLVGAAPAALDTLNELAAAIADDANFSTTVTNQIAAITHDGLTGFVANEHIDWTAASAGTIDPSNYVNTNTGILSIVEDTTPQLGGDLDIQTFDITSSAADFEILLGAGSNLTSIGIGGLSEAGLTGGGIGIQSSTNSGSDVILLGDMDFASGITTGEVIGMMAVDNTTSKVSINGLSTVLVNGSASIHSSIISDLPIIHYGNVGTSNEVGLAVGTGSDARIHQLNASGNTIFKLPAADGSANQVLKTDGSGDLSWTAQTGNTDTTYTAGTNVSISAGNVISATDTNTDTNTTYTAGNGLTLTGTVFTMSGSYTGNFTATGDITAYSDRRLKRNIETIDNPLEIVNALRGVNFEKDGRHSTGVIAQEVEEVFPAVVHTDADGMKSVAYGNITGLLLEAIKEQQILINSLQDQINNIK